VTGTSSVASEVVGKQLEALRTAVPGLSRVSILWNPGNRVFQSQQAKEAEDSARVLRLRLDFFEVRSGAELPGVLAAIAKSGARALHILVDPMLAGHYAQIARFAVEHRLATVTGAREFADVGGLIGYGPNYSELHKRAAYYVARILKGADPAELPIEQPSKFELVINLKTAKALGLRIPPHCWGGPMR